MVLWNDLLPAQRVSVFESGIDLAETDLSLGEQRRRKVSYRIGSMVAPALREREALLGVLEDWTGAIRTGRAPMTDGHAGLRVLRVLEAAQASLCERLGSRPLCGRWRASHDRRRGPSSKCRCSISPHSTRRCTTRSSTRGAASCARARS